MATSDIEKLRKKMADAFGHEVEIIAASIRSANHVREAALMGADIATVPYSAMKKCVMHPLTTQGLEKFAADWAKVVNA